MPSESEGFPLAAVEAFAVGRPVVAFNCGGLSDLLQDGVTGLLVSPGANDAFAEAAVSLLLDGARRTEFGANARAAAAEFSLERHVRQLLTVYEETLSSVCVRPAPVARTVGPRS